MIRTSDLGGVDDRRLQTASASQEDYSQNEGLDAPERARDYDSNLWALFLTSDSNPISWRLLLAYFIEGVDRRTC
jgi:hypothetical protein